MPINNEPEPVRAWLNSLDEPAFRDRVLQEVFKNMKKKGTVLSFTPGRSGGQIPLPVPSPPLTSHTPRRVFTARINVNKTTIEANSSFEKALVS